MKEIEFTWDEHKNRINLQKHGVTFQEAQTAFYDEMARLIDDPDHSIEEHRVILLGMSQNMRMLIVCHAYDERTQCIRIISARKANQKEQRQYGRFYI